MPTSVTMPQLGESVTEGTVTRWLKQVGDTVQADEPLLEVSTDKVDTEIPSPASGVLSAISVAEDEVAQVGAQLAVIDEAGASTASAPAPAAAEAPAEAPAASAPPAEPPAAAPAAPAAAASPAPAAVAGTPVTLPALGESVAEGTVTRWLKAVGDTVQADEPLLEVSTDKVDTEIPAPVSGVLLSIDVPEDTTVDVGAQLGVIGAAGASPAPAAPTGGAPSSAVVTESQSDATPPAPTQPSAASQSDAVTSTPAPTPNPAAAAPTPAPTPAPASNGQGGESPYATPLVRRLAAEHGVDLNSITGTGVGGRIRKQDVLDAASKQPAAAATPAPAAPAAPAPAAPAPAAPAAAAPAPAPAQAQAPAPAQPAAASPSSPANRGTTEPMSRLRKVIAARMVESLQTSAQLTTVLEADVTAIARLRERAKRQFEEREGVKLSFLPFFVLATIDALKAHPKLNASIDGDAVVYHEGVHLGVAVDTDRGLLVPVIHDAGDLNIGGLARKIADLAERTRGNKITPDELGGGTFTLTNTGSRGALFDTPIINQPQVGILGTGSVVKRAVVVEDEFGGESIAVRSMVYLALTYDHRLVDGADAARFLTSVKERLEDGAFEGELGLTP